jgi:hypothetical protein
MNGIILPEAESLRKNENRFSGPGATASAYPGKNRPQETFH